MPESTNQPLCRLIYFSRVADDFEANELDAILQVSRTHNVQAGITGILTFDPVYFMQALEGPRDAVNELYNRIVIDRRHDHVYLVEYQLTDDLRFTDWTMAVAKLPELPGRFLEQQFGGFKPPNFSADIAREFLEILRDYLKRDPLAASWTLP